MALTFEVALFAPSIATTMIASAQSFSQTHCFNFVCVLGEPSSWLVVIVFKVAAIMLFIIASKAIDSKSALLEKSLPASSAPTPRPARVSASAAAGALWNRHRVLAVSLSQSAA